MFEEDPARHLAERRMLEKAHDGLEPGWVHLRSPRRCVGPQPATEELARAIGMCTASLTTLLRVVRLENPRPSTVARHRLVRRDGCQTQHQYQLSDDNARLVDHSHRRQALVLL